MSKSYKILFFGGQKSGKSKLAEKKTLEISNSKPYYIATYNNSYDDIQMDEKILQHKNTRQNKFITIEEFYNLDKCIQKEHTYLVDCLSMWIFNNIDKPEEFFLKQIDIISNIDANIVFVLNDVNTGIIPLEKQSRRFVDLSGIVGAKICEICNEVYEVKYSLTRKWK